LPEATQFRIIFLTRPQEVSPQSLADPGIAVCLPASERALKEPQAPYLEAAAEEASTYASGALVTQLPLPVAPQAVFSLPELRQQIDLLARALLTMKDVHAMRTYLDAVELPEDQKELALDRLAILEQLDPAQLLANPHLWSSLEALFDWFKSRYRPLYLGHHQAYHRSAASLHDRLLRAKPQLEALGRLNSIAELGPPLAQGLFSQYERLEPALQPCPLWESDAAPEPPCPACGLKLGHQVPQREVERFLGQLEKALGQQLGRLSSQAIGQILARSHQAKIDQFLEVVQASDLASLVNVLDDELVAFLRQLLAG